MDGTIAVFDVPAGKLLNTLTGHHKPVRDVCFTPGAAQLSLLGRIKLGNASIAADDVELCCKQHELRRCTKEKCASAADSQMLLTACDDMHTHLYDVENAALIEAFSGVFRPLDVLFKQDFVCILVFTHLQRLFPQCNKGSLPMQGMSPGCSAWIAIPPALPLLLVPAMPK